MAKPTTTGRLNRIGVYGFEEVEPLILAALVTEDPLLLIGKCGTGKTYLLNSLSETMRLEHRHYNASTISFDDLVGFPYPTEDFKTVSFLQTPATVWGAESVLVDEISRCKPEHQNRLFSLIYERRIQGMKLESLRYRWAAMNPCSLDQGVGDLYEGSEPLDQALADRFAFVVEVPDWDELDEENQRLIADPRGEGAISNDDGEIFRRVQSWSKVFQQLVQNAPRIVIDYCRIAATVLGVSGCRISPRRVRQFVKNVLAVSVVCERGFQQQQFLLALRWSLPHRAWGETPKEETIRAAHRTAWDAACAEVTDKWLSEFHLEPKLSRKVRKLIKGCPEEDTGTLAVTQLLAGASKEDAAAFAVAVYPLALQGKLPIGKEGVNDLGQLANEILDLNGEIEWQERSSEQGTEHPEFGRLSEVLTNLTGRRRERATQLFYYLLANNIVLANPRGYEEEFNGCINLLRPLAKA